MKTISFRGLLADEGIDKIYLAGDEPGDGYRIKKFEVMYQDPGGTNAEGVMKIFTIPQTTTTDKIDFSDNTLLAAAYIENRNNNDTYGDQTVVFDNITFNQDIYITFNESNSAAVSCNYHIELEMVKLSNGEQAITNFVAALQHGE